MSIKVIIPSPFQKLTANNHTVEVEAGNIGEMIANLERRFPGLKSRLYDEKGVLHKFINIYINEEDIRFLQKEATSLKNNDEVMIIPAIAGG
jgi:molybdopterin synthase sulfur carrier subunit